MSKVCPKCDVPLERRPKQYHWRGVDMHGWVCLECASLWDIGDAFVRYVAKVARRSPNTGIGLSKEDFKLTFATEGEEIGRFWWDEDARVLRFEGDADTAAEYFLSYVIEQHKDWFEAKYGGERKS